MSCVSAPAVLIRQLYCRQGNHQGEVRTPLGLIFIVIGARVRLLESGPGHCTLATFKHSSILEKGVKTAMNSVPLIFLTKHIWLLS